PRHARLVAERGTALRILDDLFAESLLDERRMDFRPVADCFFVGHIGAARPKLEWIRSSIRVCAPVRTDGEGETLARRQTTESSMRLLLGSAGRVKESANPIRLDQPIVDSDGFLGL